MIKLIHLPQSLLSIEGVPDSAFPICKQHGIDIGTHSYQDHGRWKEFTDLSIPQAKALQAALVASGHECKFQKYEG